MIQYILLKYAFLHYSAHKVFHGSEGLAFTWDEGVTQHQREFTARGNKKTKRKGVNGSVKDVSLIPQKHIQWGKRVFGSH